MANCEGCFAGYDGKCGILIEKPSGECRFYKTRLQVAQERGKSEIRLYSIGRSDLVYRYLIHKEEHL